MLGKATCPPYLKKQFLVFQNVKFLLLFFKICFYLFVNLGPYGRKHSNDISSESTHQIHSQNISCILLERASTKLVQRIVNFQIMDFCHFFFVLVNMGPYGVNMVKASNGSSERKNTPDLLLMHTPGEGLYLSISQRVISLLSFQSARFCPGRVPKLLKE